jgi:hypothetical protein
VTLADRLPWKPSRRPKRYDETELVKRLSLGPQDGPETVTVYYVVGASHGTTEDFDKARDWALRRSFLSGEPAFVVSHQQTRTPWVVAAQVQYPDSGSVVS